MLKILKFKWWILSFTFLAFLGSVYLIPQLEAEYDFEKFFPADDENLLFYQQFKEAFGSEDFTLMISFQSEEKTIFSKAFFTELASINSTLGELDNVTNASSLANIKTPTKTPFGTVLRPLVNINGPGFTRDSLRIHSNKYIRNIFLSQDQNAASVVMAIDTSISEVDQDQLIHEIDSICINSTFPKYHVAGSINLKRKYTAQLEQENKQIIPMFIFCAIIILTLVFRNSWIVVISSLGVLLGLVLLFGYACLIGRHYSVTTVLYPTIMVVVGLSDIIHLYTKYINNTHSGMNKITAITKALKEIRITLLLTSVTTMVGFFTIAKSSIPHVAHMGSDAIVGVIIAFIIAVMLVPILLYFAPIPVKDPGQSKAHNRWLKLLKQIHRFSLRREKLIVIGFIGIILLSLYGIQKINTNNYLMGIIFDHVPYKKDYLFFEDNYVGVRAFELSVKTKSGAPIKSIPVLKEIEKIHHYLDQIDGLGPIMSPIAQYQLVHNIIYPKAVEQFTIPDSLAKLSKYDQLITMGGLDLNINKAGDWARMNAKMKDVGRLQVAEMNAEFKDWLALHVDSTLIEVRNTGSALLRDENNVALINEMLSSITIAFIIISFIMTILFRNIRMVLISLIPNIIPLLITAGIMGLTGIELNGTTAIIFTISFVIAVDDTIHFLSKYQIERKKQKSINTAIKNTILITGKGILITSLVLMGGYLITLFSDFKEAYYHGVLICITLFFAVLGDLFLLPVLLRRFDKA